MGCEEHPDVLTPNLDALAAGGARMRRAYCQDAICVPSRLSLMTGLYPRTLGVLENPETFRGEVAPIAGVLGQNGYHCAAFGKRHLMPVGSAVDAGWHEHASSIVHESPQDNYCDWLDRRGLLETFARDWGTEWAQGPHGTRLESTAYPFTVFSTQPTELPEDATMEAWVGQRTIDFLERRKNQDGPFFCWSSFYRPHQPYTAHPKYLSMYDARKWGPGRRHGGAIRMPNTLRQNPATLPPGLQDWFAGKNRVWRIDLARQNEQIYRDYIAAYYALVTEIDHWIGQILAALDRLGLRQNTIVIYTADHGDFVGQHGMIEKDAAGHNIYEETLRVPLIVNWPGAVASGQVSDELVQLLDIYPTLLDLSGSKGPSTPGQSLRRLLQDREPLGREFVVSENWTQTTVITPRYKLGRWNVQNGMADMLLDRHADPEELRNVLGEPAMAETANVLREHLAAWEREVPDRRFPRERGLAPVRP